LEIHNGIAHALEQLGIIPNQRARFRRLSS
jgi:hypothetical protein